MLKTAPHRADRLTVAAEVVALRIDIIRVEVQAVRDVRVVGEERRRPIVAFGTPVEALVTAVTGSRKEDVRSGGVSITVYFSISIGNTLASVGSIRNLVGDCG